MIAFVDWQFLSFFQAKPASSNILQAQVLTIISFYSTSVSSLTDDAKCLNSISYDGNFQKKKRSAAAHLLLELMEHA